MLLYLFLTIITEQLWSKRIFDEPGSEVPQYLANKFCLKIMCLQNAGRREFGVKHEITFKISMLLSGLATSWDCHNMQDIEYKLCRPLQYDEMHIPLQLN